LIEETVGNELKDIENYISKDLYLDLKKSIKKE